MKVSISRKIILYITAIMAGSVLISYFIFHNVIKETYKIHFIEEMVKSELVLNDYLENRYVLIESGLDILLSDPRFLASIADDHYTAQMEIADFKELVQADFLVVTDTAGNVLAKTGDIKVSNWKMNNLKPHKYQRGDEHFYAIYNDSLYQVLTASIYFFNRFPLGKLIAGYLIDNKLIKKFEQLSGAEIALFANNKIIEKSSEGLSVTDTDLNKIINHTKQPGVLVQTFELDEDYLVLNYTFNPGNAGSMLLIKSLDQLLNPVMNKITIYLLFFNILVLLISILFIYKFTSKNLTGAVNNLVQAANKISRNEFNEPVKAKNQDELGFLAESFDKMRLTLKDNSEKLVAAQEERIRSERLATIGQIAAGIIHDFKNPMTIITMSTEILAKGNVDEASHQKYCQNIKIQIDRMVNMAQDILDFSHGKKSLNLTAVEFTDALEKKVEFQRQKFNNKKIDLVINSTEKFYAAIDTNKFTRVIDNLINNAYEALSPGGKVEVSVVKNDENFQVIIADNGPGIPQEIIDTIFQPFVTSGKENGTGLGLAISSKIIEDHGGKIKVHSGQNGTTFTIVLPNTLLSDENQQSGNNNLGILHEN
jgi:signal transduction histidine kinase